jgi:hypothetical protein
MLGIATILQRLKAICLKVLSIVTALIHKLHLKTIGAYLIDQMIRFAVFIKHLLVQTWLKIKPLLARYLTIAVLLTKAGLLIVLQTLGQLGQKLATIAHKTLQRAKQILKLDK